MKYTDTQYINQTKEIVVKHNLEKFIDILVDYWAENPPTLGHGFHHVLRVAVEAYQLGIENDYEAPEDLFVGGLFHDIHRPTESGEGNEDQTLGAEIVKKLFSKNEIDSDLTSKVVAMINSHDNWRHQENPPQYDLLISVADKICMNSLLSDSYVWAVNNHALEGGNKPILTSHFTNLANWLNYQTRAWEIFKNYRQQVTGIEAAIASYIESTKDAFKKYENDPRDENFFAYFESRAKEATQLEEEYLQEFLEDNQKIAAIMEYTAN